MRRVIYTLILNLVLAPIYSQIPDSLLRSIEANNPVIKAGAAWLESERTRSKTGIYPDNPEITWNYMWGSPDAIGDQKELEISQSFMFPGYYTARSSMQKLDFSQKEIMVEKSRKEVLFKAANEVIMLTWLGKKESLLVNKLNESTRLREMMQTGFERNEISKPAYDKIRLYHLRNQTELGRLRSEIATHLESLKMMNGGIPVNFSFTDYGSIEILPDLDELSKKILESNPDIRIARINMEIRGSQVRVEKMNRLPKFEAGYKGETILNQELRGIHTGITIPLWENRNKVKQAKLEESWSDLNYEQVVAEVNSALRMYYLKAQSALNLYNNALEIVSDQDLSISTNALLTAGEISFPEYLTEIQLIFDNQLSFLETERDYFLILNDLRLLSNN